MAIWHEASIRHARVVAKRMTDTERLWRDFLTFCGSRTPDEWLALDFVQFVTADLPEPVRRHRADAELNALQVLLTWRIKRSACCEKPSRTSPAQRLRRTG